MSVRPSQLQGTSDKVPDGTRHEDLTGTCQSQEARGDVNSDPGDIDIGGRDFALARVHTDSDHQTEPKQAFANSPTARDCLSRRTERG
jgi:hypothetical protein